MGKLLFLGKGLFLYAAAVYVGIRFGTVFIDHCSRKRLVLTDFPEMRTQNRSWKANCLNTTGAYTTWCPVILRLRITLAGADLPNC